MSRLSDVLRHQGGSVVAVFALATPLVVGGATFAVDAASLATLNSHLQAVGDAAALAGARELHVKWTDLDPVEESTRQRALAMLAEKGLEATTPSVDVTLDKDASTVTVAIAATPRTVLLARLGYADRVATRSVAGVFGSTKLCVMALAPDGGGTLKVERIGSIQAADCAVQSNSGAPDAIDVNGLSSVEAVSICSAGGVAGPESAFTPAATVDCPVLEDPLAGRDFAALGPCDHRDMIILLPRTIKPGHYCGGLTLAPTALVTALPGEYVISGGKLTLGAAASLIGDGVSFRFVDAAATFSFGPGSIVRLSAPADGPTAGFLFIQDADIPKGREFLIATDLATELVGTIYLPSGTLKVDVVGLVAAQSAYTVVLTDRLEVKGADLVINSDYGATDIPVPRGIGPTGGMIALVQ